MCVCFLPGDVFKTVFQLATNYSCSFLFKFQEDNIFSYLIKYFSYKNESDNISIHLLSMISCISFLPVVLDFKALLPKPLHCQVGDRSLCIFFLVFFHHLIIHSLHRPDSVRMCVTQTQCIEILLPRKVIDASQ